MLWILHYAHVGVWVCYYRPPFFLTIFGFGFSTWCIVCLYIYCPLYLFDRTTTDSLPLLYLQPRIETYLADFISRPYWMIGFRTLFWRGTGCIRIDYFCSHFFIIIIFFIILLNFIFLFLSCLTYLHGDE